MSDSDINNQSFYKQTAQQTLQYFKVNPNLGLNDEEVQQRLKTYGPNKIQAHKRKSIFMLFVQQLQDALIYVLLGAVVITMLMGEYIYGIIILIVILHVNVIPCSSYDSHITTTKRGYWT